MLAASYDPWARVAERPDWRVEWEPLPRPFLGATEHHAGVTYIAIHPGQTAQEERAALAHEIAHAERVSRGRVLPTDEHRDPLNRREERHCRLRAALRLVGLWPIVQMILELRASGEFNPWLYAEDLGVPPRLLLDLLAYLGRVIGPIYPEWAS